MINQYSIMGGMSVAGTVNGQYKFDLGMEEDDFTVGSLERRRVFQM